MDYGPAHDGARSTFALDLGASPSETTALNHGHILKKSSFDKFNPLHNDHLSTYESSETPFRPLNIPVQGKIPKLG